ESFVPPAYQRERRALGKLPKNRLRKRATLWSEEHAVRTSSFRTIFVERLHAGHEAIDPHHHPRAAAVGRVVDLEMAPDAEVARAFQAHSEYPAAHRPSHEARR